MSIKTPTPPAPLPKWAFPKWTDAPAVISYLTSLVAAIFVVVSLVSSKGEPTVLRALIPAVGLVIAGGAQLFNVISHRKVQVAVAAALSSPTNPILPSWTDAASVTSYLTSLIAAVFAIVTSSTGKGEPAAVQAILPAVGFLIAGVAQIVNVVMHRNVQKAALIALKH